MSTFWTVTFGIGAAQGVFLLLALGLQRFRNRRAARVLMAIVAVFTTMTAIELVESGGDEPLRLGWIYAQVSVSLLLPPLLFLFVRALLDPERAWRRGHALHAAPFLAGALLWGVAWIVSADRMRPFGLAIDDATFGYVVAKAVVFFAYLAAVFRELRPHLGRDAVFTVGRRRVGVDWLAWWAGAAGLVAGIVYLNELFAQLEAPLPWEPDQLGTLLLTGVVFALSLSIVLRPWVLSLQPNPATAAPFVSDLRHLEGYLERHRPWTDPDLDLGGLAERTGFTESRLSALVNEGLSTTFYGLLNRRRLAEFERLAREPELRDRTVLDLAHRAGFNSKASFYRAFREVHATTPTAYRKAVSVESGSH